MTRPAWHPEKLRAARLAAGYTQEALAEAITTLDLPGFTPPAALAATIRGHETGQHRPGPAYQRAYCQVFGRSAADLGFRRHGDPSLTTRAVETNAAPGHHGASNAVPADDGLERLWTSDPLIGMYEEVTRPLTALPRREFLALSGVLLAGAAHEWLVSDPARIAAALTGRQADAAVIADLNSGVDLVRRLDDKLGGQAVYGMVIEQLRLVVGILRNASYTQPDGRALHAIAAELARLAGWTSQDAGHHGTAQRFYLVGLRAAHEADHPGIAANILRCMATQACGLQDPRTAIELLRSARAGTRGRLTATENAILAGQLSLAHGRAQDRLAAQAAADEAHEHIARAQPDQDPPYVYWASAHTIAYYTGASLIFSGDPAAAMPHLRSAIATIGDDLPRDLVHYRARLAIAHVRAGTPEAGLQLAHETINEAAPVASFMAQEQVADICREVRATGHPGASDLAEHARSIVGTASL